MITLDHVTFAYPNATPVLQDFNWRVERGERWAILGPSGCGKTTLLYLLAGLRQASAGEVRIDGQAITRPRPHSGLILQEYGLLPWMTVRGNVALGLRIRNFYGADGVHAPVDAPQRCIDVQQWLQRLGLAGLADNYPAQLSGGQRQRTAIARTLALHPDLLLMDEPFSSLDAMTRANLQMLTLELCAEQNLTLVMVTHAITEAAIMGQKILLLGQPPNTRPQIIANPRGGEPGYKESQAYNALCQDLRQRMEAAT